jgi:hypothetical protein
MATTKGDPEVEAMGKLAGALDGLDTEQHARILRWAADRYGIALIGRKPSLGGDGNSGDGGGGGADPTEHKELGDLFSAASPQTDEDRVLLVAYWLQELQEEKLPNFGSQPVNTELKHLGHGVENITRVFDALIATSPQQVIQTRKSGTSKQARKSYKVTKAGIKRIRELLDDTSA